jgi:ribosomal protein S18 acetylase RimI-like enzyme
VSVEYRMAGRKDATILAEIGAKTFTETFGHLYDPADLALFLVNHNEEHWAAELADPEFAVRLAEADGEVIAYAKIGPPHLPFEPRGEAIELRQFYVLSGWHGQGIADQMMRWAIDEAQRRGGDDLYLSVFVDNHRARRFYERWGFVAEGRYAFMVGSHADEDIVMRRPL